LLISFFKNAIIKTATIKKASLVVKVIMPGKKKANCYKYCKYYFKGDYCEEL